jgi:mono/diheme cytochrome c family protein
MLVLFLALGCSSPSDKETGGDTSATGDDTSAAVTGDAANGEALFSSCAGCHNADGSGGVDIGGTPSADLRVRVPALSDSELSDRIMNGFGTAMPAQYSDAQDVADVIAYLRATFP